MLPIGGVCDAEFEEDTSKVRLCGIAAERTVVDWDAVETRRLQAVSSGNQSGGTNPAGVLIADRLRRTPQSCSALDRIWQHCWKRGHVLNSRTISLVLPVRPSIARRNSSSTRFLLIPWCRSPS